ncbi:MAG: ABC transporter substrate-binding protein [Oscillospiraceae bacterium]|nr:ABC transporter substrate-binding protein [Oscillospiraceae bacterium]
MKRLLSLLLIAILLVNALPAAVFAAEETVTINIYNWGQYISDGTDDCIDVISEFEAAYPNIKVNYMTFDSNESMYTKLKAGGSTFDIIIPSDYMVQKLIEEDMLEQLDFSNIPNFEYIDDSFKNLAYDPENLYSVPYTWGCVGVIYNTKYVDPEDIGSWDLLWNAKYAGKILMFDNPRDAFAIAEAKLGYSINTEDSTLLTLAANELRAQKPLVQAYVMDQIFDKMERGEAWIAPYYAGDYLLMVEENPDLAFYFPEEGFNRFVDAICVPKGAEHKDAAEAFINFLLDPEICAQNLEYLGYSAPSSAAKELMDPELADNPIAYPDEETLANGSFFSALSQRGTQEMDSLWTMVKTADTATTVYLIMTIAAIALVVFLWIFFKVRKRKRKARRCAKWKTA